MPSKQVLYAKLFDLRKKHRRCEGLCDANGNAVYNYNNTNGYYPQGGVVSINVDPMNWVPELIEYNNTASKSVY